MSESVSKQVLAKVENMTTQKTTRKDIEFYPSGITLLDLCLGGGFGKGYISNICGWEATGKTMVACETLGYNSRKDKKFKHKFDNSESGFTLDTKYLFGFKIDMIEPRSEKVEQFMYNVESTIKKLKEDDNMLYVLDSLDGLSDDREAKKHDEDMKKVKKAMEEDKESNIKGDYSGKAKGISEFLRLNNAKLEKSKTHLMITSQLRDNVGVIYGKKETRSGGKALNFYAAQIVWLYLKEKIKKKITVDKQVHERNVGNLIKAVVEKNKLGKAFRHCFLFIDFDYGIDNVTSNIYFLYNLLTPTGDRRTPSELIWDDEKFKTIEELITHIETNNLEQELEKRVKELWYKIESELTTERKKKF